MVFGRMKRAVSAAVMLTGSTVIYKVLRSMKDTVRSFHLTQFDVARAEFTLENVEIVKDANEAKFPMVGSMNLTVDKLFIKFKPFTTQIKDCSIQGVSGNVSLKLEDAFVNNAARSQPHVTAAEHTSVVSRDSASETDHLHAPAHLLHVKVLNSISISDCRLQISDPSTGVQFPLVVESLHGRRFRTFFTFLDIMFRTNTKAFIDGHPFETRTLDDAGSGECTATLPAHHIMRYIPNSSPFHHFHPHSKFGFRVSNTKPCDDNTTEPVLLNWSVHLSDAQLASAGAETAQSGPPSPESTSAALTQTVGSVDHETLFLMIHRYLNDHKHRPLQFQTTTSRSQFEGAVTPHSARLWHVLSDGMASELRKIYNQLFGREP